MSFAGLQSVGDFEGPLLDYAQRALPSLHGRAMDWSNKSQRLIMDLAANAVMAKALTEDEQHEASRRARTDSATSHEPARRSFAETHPSILLTNITKLNARKKCKDMKRDCKELWAMHVGSVLKDAKHRVAKGSLLNKIGASLSFVGELWDGVSIFWHNLSKKHAMLKVLDIFIVKPAAIALYAKILPEIGLIKACELIGKAAKNYSETGKGWSSVKKAAKDTCTTIVRHAARLCLGIDVNPGVTKFFETLGLSVDAIKVLTDPESMRTLKSLPASVSTSLAEKITKVIGDKDDLGAAVLVESALAAMKKSLHIDTTSLQKSIEHCDPEKYPALKTFFDNYKGKPELNELLDAAKKAPDLGKGMREVLKSYIVDFTTSQVIQSLDLRQAKKPSVATEAVANTRARKVTFAEQFPKKEGSHADRLSKEEPLTATKSIVTNV